MKVASESGASTWLSMLPIQENGFQRPYIREHLLRLPANLRPLTCVLLNML